MSGPETARPRPRLIDFADENPENRLPTPRRGRGDHGIEAKSPKSLIFRLPPAGAKVSGGTADLLRTTTDLSPGTAGLSGATAWLIPGTADLSPAITDLLGRSLTSAVPPLTSVSVPLTLAVARWSQAVAALGAWGGNEARDNTCRDSRTDWRDSLAASLILAGTMQKRLHFEAGGLGSCAPRPNCMAVG